jgi:hypothetical protein
VTKTRTTTVRFRDWPWHARLIEKLYRLTRGGKIRTLVLSGDQLFPDGQPRRRR